MKRTLSLFLMIAVATASLPALAGQPVLRAIPKTIELKLGAQDNDQLKEIEADIRINQIYTEYVKKQTTCSEVVCKDIDSDGSKGDWKNYFNVSKSLKPRALADAIKGIGETTAERIIDLGFFSKKPRSWYAFSNEILNAQRALNDAGYNYNFSDNVLGQYGYENAINLGYYVENACTTRKYDCYTYVPVEREEFYKYVPVRAKVIAHNMTLQSFESEKFYITLNHIAGEADIRVDGYNRYAAPEIIRTKANETSIELTATERIKRELPSEAVKATLARDSQGFALNVSIPAQYFTTEDAGAKNIIKYEVCKEHSFWKTCDKVVRAARATPLKNSLSQTIRLDKPEIAYESGKKYFVRWSITRSGSKFYADKYNTQPTTTHVAY